MQYFYYINLDERGDFYADVRDENDNTVYEIKSIEQLNELIDNGFMRHSKDIEYLESYLMNIEFINSKDTLEFGN